MAVRRFSRMRRALIAAPWVVVILAGAPLLLPRYLAVAPRGELYPSAKLATELDSSLLGDGLIDRTVVEIDWIEGCKPGPQTVAGLETILKKYSPPGRSIEIVIDQEIPHVELSGSNSPGEIVARLVERYAGVERARAPRTAWRYLLFVPTAGVYFGHTFNVPVTRDALTTVVQGLIVSRSAHLRYAWFWIDLDLLERMTLVHEFGHLLGLVRNPHHERREPAHRGHCTSLTCSMAHPTWRVIARNFVAGVFNRYMSDYCADCQDDIRRAQAYWRATVPAR